VASEGLSSASPCVPGDAPLPRPTRRREDRSLSLARARGLKRRGRAFLFWGAILYAVAQLSVCPLLNRWRAPQSHQEYRKWLRLRELVKATPDRPLVLMLGSSRTCYAFRAGQLNGKPGPDGRPLLAYNFGVLGAGPMHEWMYLRKMLAEGIRPRLLLIEYAAPLMCKPARGLTSEESTLATRWLTTDQLVHLWPYLTQRRQIFRDWVLTRLAPWYNLRYEMHGDLQQMYFALPPAADRRPVDEWGWCQLSTEPPPLLLSAFLWRSTYLMYHDTMGPRFRLADSSRRAMWDLLDLCHRERIPTALVLMPESSIFRSWESDEARSGPAALLADLRNHYHLPLIDASNWLGDEDFEDGHHELLSGANRFTERMAQEIQRLLAQPAEEDKVTRGQGERNCCEDWMRQAVSDHAKPPSTNRDCLTLLADPP
jgi:hypothetical protein